MSNSPRVISPRLTNELTYLIREKPRSYNSDRTIRFLLEHDLELGTLIFCRCRCRLHCSEMAIEIEERILEKEFLPLFMSDLIEIKDLLFSRALQQRLYGFAERLLDQHEYFTYPWLIAKTYPELREKVGEWFLADEFLDLVQIDYTLKFFSTELQKKLITRIENEGQYSLFEMLRENVG